MIALLLSSLLLSDPAAAAAKATFCRPGTTIIKKVPYCEKNGIYLRQAKECEEALKKKVGAASTALQAMLAVKTSASAQAAKFGQSGSNYGISSAQLNMLAVQAGVAAADVLAYQDSVVQPEDTDNPDIAGPDAQKYADGVPCYGDTMKGIKEANARLKKIQADLLAAASASSAYEKASSAAAAGVGAGDATTTAVPAGSAAAPSALPALKGMPQPKGESDISGTKPVKEK